jgi:hypothetical protein
LITLHTPAKDEPTAVELDSKVVNPKADECVYEVREFSSRFAVVQYAGFVAGHRGSS